MRITTPLALATFAALTSAAVAFRPDDDTRGGWGLQNDDDYDVGDSGFDGEGGNYGAGFNQAGYDGGVFHALAIRNHQEKADSHAQKASQILDQFPYFKDFDHDRANLYQGDHSAAAA